MKRPFINVGGKLQRAFYLALFSTFLLSSCNHGEGGKENPKVEDLKDLTIKTLSIKNADGKLGSVIFKGESVTINKGDIIIQFEEEWAPKHPENHESFTFSKQFPITVQKGKEEKLKISIAKTNKYNVWEKEVSIICTDLGVLNIKPPIKVHGENVENGVVKLKEEFKKVEEGNVEVSFLEPDAPAHRFEGLPIELKAGESKKFKIVTEATAKYKKFEAEITVVCEIAELTLKKITVYDEDVENDNVIIPLEHASVAKENIKIYFEQADASTEVFCEPETLSLQLGEMKSLKVCVNATAKYKKFERTINVKRQDKKTLSLKTLTIWGLSASSKSVTINEESVAKTNVALVFLESDAPSEFNVSPQPFTLNKGETKLLTISTEETEKYKAWSIEVSVKRKDENAPKTIDDAIEALKGQLTWVNSHVDSDIALLTEIAGFDGSNVKWVESSHTDHCNILGIVNRDIVDIQVELKATVTWNGETKDVILKTTVGRIKTIVDDEKPKTKITWDFSEENVLKRLHNGKETHLWKIKSVDIEKGLFVVELKKRALENDKGNLLDIEDYSKKEVEEDVKFMENHFGATYVELKKKAVINWEDIKPYILGLDKFYNQLWSNPDDEDIFDIYALLVLYYGDSLDSFKALPDDERTKVVKDGLDKFKERYCAKFNLPKNTLDEELVNKFEEKINKLSVFKNENRCKEQTYFYGAGKKYFEAFVAYNSEKKWCEQIGNYNYRSSDGEINLHFDKISDTEVEVYLKSAVVNAEGLFIGVCELSQSEAQFNLNERYKDTELQCVVNVESADKITLITAGSFSKTCQILFKGCKIEDL